MSPKLGPGVGIRRRIRTTLRVTGNVATIYVKTPGKNVQQPKHLPANWRSLLVELVNKLCDVPPTRFFAGGVVRRIPRPNPTVLLGSLPTTYLSFVLDLDPWTAGLQRRAIDTALRQLDVMDAPVPKITVSYRNKGECFVTTDLQLHDRFVFNIFHQFNTHYLRDTPGINWQHLQQFKAKGNRLGIKTTCGQPCSCRENLPKLWHLGWWMQY